MATELLRRLHLRWPIIQAPMGGAGPTNPAFLAAVADQGILGFLGAAYLAPESIDARLAELRRRTSRPVGVNLFLPAAPARFTEDEADRALRALAPHHLRLGLPRPALPPLAASAFADQLDVVLQHRPPVVSFTFGAPSRDVVRRCHDTGALVFGTATNVAEARSLEQAGVDAIVAQGAEAGGHRCTFDATPTADGFLTAGGLIAAVVDAVSVPVIAAGGIMDGGAIRDVLRRGAIAAQLGTVFLACAEAEISSAYRRALLDPSRRSTTWIRCFSGRVARGIPNRFTDAYIGRDEAILPYPIQNALTGDLRRRSAEVGDPEHLALWAGTGVSRLPAAAVRVADVVGRLATELGDG